MRRITWLCLVAAASFCCPALADVNDLQKGFLKPPDNARIMMRWWWFGPAVTKAQLEKEMRAMKEGGIGGFEIQPVYAVALDDPSRGFKNLPFLSPEHLDALRFTAEKSRELGLRVDLTLGSGWPYGAATTPITEAAGRMRVVRLKPPTPSGRITAPDVGNGEQLVAVFSARTKKEIAPPVDGAVHVADGDEAIFFISSRTGQQVKRPAVGAEGFVINHYDKQATQNYLRTVADPMVKVFVKPPDAVFCDSLEVYLSDWTPDLLTEFQRRRGYDLRPYLPQLTEDGGPEAAGVRYDWGKTLTELLEERFLTTMRDYARAHNTKFRIQGYGVPPATMSSNAYADIAEGEGAQWKIVRASRWASSANHIYGHPVTSSETWTWLHSPSFRATPLDMKAEADIHFIQGINQLIGHGWPYTAEGVEYPGWRFYASAVLNDKNPWYHVMPDIALYLQRVSWLLRQGRIANDVALYLPNSDAYAAFTVGKVHMIEALRDLVGNTVMPQILDSGYGLDFFDDGALPKLGSPYRVVVLPGVELIPAASMRQLEAFVKAGGTLIATRSIPASAPGLRTLQAEKDEVKAVAQRLFEGPNAPAILVKDESELGAALKRKLTPDMALEPASPDVGFIHRKTDDAEIYFIANTSNQAYRGKAAYRVSGMLAESWNPMTGEVTPGAADLNIEPYGSRVIVFTMRSLPAPAKAKLGLSPVDITGAWKVTFPNGQSTSMSALKSWTDDEKTRFISGLVTYENNVNVTQEMIGARWLLDFGEGAIVPPPAGPRAGPGMQARLDGPVREAAVVEVNGQRAGSVWMPPYKLDITKFLKSGINTLRITVGNTAMNYMAGRPMPDYKLLNLRFTEKFTPQEMNLVTVLPSGLTGTVRLIPGM